MVWIRVCISGSAQCLFCSHGEFVWTIILISDSDSVPSGLWVLTRVRLWFTDCVRPLCSRSFFCVCIITWVLCIADVSAFRCIYLASDISCTAYVSPVGYRCMFVHSSSVSFVIIRCFIDRFRTLELSLLSSAHIVETTHIWYYNTTLFSNCSWVETPFYLRLT